MSIVSLLILTGALLVPISIIILLISSTKNNKHNISYDIACPKCGTKTTPEQTFCTTCGQKLK